MWLRVGFLALAAAVTGLAVFLIVTVPAIIPGSALPAYSPDVGMARWSSTQAGVRPATPPQGRTAPCLEAGSRFRRHSGPSMRPTFHQMQTTASVAGAKPTSSPRSSGERRRQVPTTFPRFPTAPISALGSRTSATSSPTSRPCRRCRAGYATTTSPFRSMSADWSAAGNSCSSIASHCLRTLRGRRNGIGAPISSTASAIAPNVTAPQFSRRHCGLATICRWTEPGRRGMGTEHHAKGLALLVGKGRRLFPCDR